MKKEKLYVNRINKTINNNQNYCDVLESTFIDSTNNSDVKLSVNEKLKRLFNTNGYIFNVDVKIITDSKTYNTKIAGKVGNNIITLDNDIIRINDIKDIIY